MNVNTLQATARTLVNEGKGILAMDESTPTCGRRLEAVGVANTESNRRDYRELLLSTPELEQYISGAILYDETLRQSTRDGTPFAAMMAARGIQPGIKVDTGAKPLAGHPGETVTEGLDGLRQRLIEYRQLGATFCKWRAVIDPARGVTSRGGIEANAHALARYAALCQEAELVPIVEPEVLMDGDHTLERCHHVTGEVLTAVFRELRAQRVALPGMILKASMVLPGRDCALQAEVAEVARATLDCLYDTVPAAVPGVAFLSGGQSDERASVHLDAMNRQGPHPWRLSFSYGRALQTPALKTWAGRASHWGEAQQVLLHRARCNSAASLGRYDDNLERAA